MTEEESLFVRIKIIVNMHNSGAISLECALGQILDLAGKYKLEEHR